MAKSLICFPIITLNIYENSANIGLHEIFVNTVVDDGTDIAELMSCFTKKEVKNNKFPVLSSEVKRLKETEGGLSTVCEVMQMTKKARHNI